MEGPKRCDDDSRRVIELIRWDDDIALVNKQGTDWRCAKYVRDKLWAFRNMEPCGARGTPSPTVSTIVFVKQSCASAYPSAGGADAGSLVREPV
jgi:hypothetical protein